MKVLVINGSPKGQASNTYRLTKAFLEGMEEVRSDVEVRTRHTNQLQIAPCKGCFGCWNKTPGQCVIHDDMSQVIEDLVWADVTIWSFPLYYFNVPGPIKTLMDRMLPMNLPFMSQETESGGHPSRYAMEHKKTVVISTCGFYTSKGNYECVDALFRRFQPDYTAIYCGQGELFRVKELSSRTDQYLAFVKQAGQEYVQGGIQTETRDQLETLLYPRETFEQMADASWGIDENGQKEDESFIFTRQMAALYNPKSYTGKDIILEMNYTDIGKTYQLILGKEKSEVIKEGFGPYTTRVNTPFTVWESIAKGEISGPQAMMERKYTVDGSFDTMVNWDTYFSSTQPTVPQTKETSQKDTNMLILLLPWMALWCFGAINSVWGSAVCLGVCAFVPLLFYRHKKTMYDQISLFVVPMCAIALWMGMSDQYVITVSYGLFGLMWFVSSFLTVPLTAHYSMNQYGKEQALQNPLFIKTNRILTMCWGILYLFTPIWTYFLMMSWLHSYVGLINSVTPIGMGIFTAWFQKWYPARMAR